MASEGLRPRDIQARIRAGQSSAEVAEASGMPVDMVARFEAPVLAERAHVADKARFSEVRGLGTTVDVLVSATLRARGVDPDSVAWDSWRRDDGRWAVALEYDGRTAMFTYDLVARAVVPDDADAKALLDPSAAPPREERPRLVSVPPSPDDVFDVEAPDAPAASTEEPGPEPEPARPAPPGRPRAKGKRASVPSWDDILFGKDDGPV